MLNVPKVLRHMALNFNLRPLPMLEVSGFWESKIEIVVDNVFEKVIGGPYALRPKKIAYIHLNINENE